MFCTHNIFDAPEIRNICYTFAYFVDVDDDDIPEEVAADNEDVPGCLHLPLYEGATETVRYALKGYLKAFTDKATSKQHLSDTLSHTHTILPQPNLLPTSYGQVFNLISKETLTIHKTNVCVKECSVFTGDEMHCHVCGEPRFKPPDTLGRKMPRRMFSHTSIGQSLELLFGCKNIAKIIQAAGGCKPQNIVTDVQETSFWQMEQTSELKIIMGFNTDGVNPFHTTNSKYSFWPLIFTVMNLPKYVRNKSDALILYGLVPSKTKVAGAKGIEPELRIYQEMMVDELLTLASVEIYSAYTKAPLKVKIEVLLYMMDFQGYAKYFSMSGAVSYQPCLVCTIRSTRLDQKMVILGHRSYNAATLKRDYRREVGEFYWLGYIFCVLLNYTH